MGWLATSLSRVQGKAGGLPAPPCTPLQRKGKPVLCDRAPYKDFFRTGMTSNGRNLSKKIREYAHRIEFVESFKTRPIRPRTDVI